MADNLNIKNPSVTEEALNLQTDSSGNIVSISGHSIAGGAGGGNVYFGDNQYIQFKTGTTNTFTLTSGVKDVIEHIPQTVETEVNRITYTKEYIDNNKQDKLTFAYDEANKISAINGSALAGQGGTYYRAGTDIIIDEYNTIKVNTNGIANSTGLAFVEGESNIASGFASHAEGLGNAVYSDYSHIEGYNNIDYKIDGLLGSNHTEGAYNKTSGVYSHNEGHANEITGYGVHVEGGYNKFYINNVSADTTHSDKTNRWNVWGISIEGMANATTAEPTSGSIEGEDYGYIHGGILKVIGNGTRTLTDPSDPSTQIINRSDALIIYRDGSISAAGNISANGVELGAGGGGGTSYQGRNGVNVNGGYIELTTTAYESVTSIPTISNDVDTLKTASGDWNKVSDKLDTTAFSTVSSTFLTAHQSLDEYATKEYANNASANALSEAETWVGNQHYLTEIPNTYALKTDIPTTVAQLTDSGNYYTKSQTSGATELSTEFAKYVTSSGITTQDTDYVMTTTGWKVLSLPGGGMTQVTHDATLTGQGNADNSKLGVAWSALSGYTINSALSAGSATSALSADKAASASASKRLQDSTSGPVIQVGDVTALQHWASSNSSTWNEVSAKLSTAQYATDSATFVTSSISTITGTKQYALTTAGWMEVSTPTIPTITAESGISADGYKIGLTNTAINAITSVSSKLDSTVAAQTYQTKGDYVKNTDIGLDANNKVTAISGKELIITAHQSLTNYYTKSETSGATEISTALGNKVDKPSSLQNKYLVLRTDSAGNVSGWCDFQDQSYSKTEALGTFVATANIDSTTLSGDGKSVSTKLGVKTDVIATRDYVNSSFLPTSGGTVSGQLVVSGDGTFDQENLKFIRSGLNGYGRIGLASNGALAVKVDDSNSNTTQINVAANASYNELIQVQHGGTSAYLIPAVTSTTTAGLTNDGILHIIVES